MNDPIVIDPPNFDIKAAWASYKENFDHVQRADGSTNWRAAFGADPGCCSCPNCWETYWHLGIRQRCVKCGFEYETNAWSAFSYGCQDAWNLDNHPHIIQYIKERKEMMWKNPYYRYGYEHAPDQKTDLYELFETIKWKEVLK